MAFSLKRKTIVQNKLETFVLFNGEFSECRNNFNKSYYKRVMDLEKDIKDVTFNYMDINLDMFKADDFVMTDEITEYIISRMSKCKNCLLVLSDSVPYIRSWILYEITLAIEVFKLPIIIAYENTKFVFHPQDKSNLWPDTISKYIIKDDFDALHIPLSLLPLQEAIKDLNIYTCDGKDTYAHYTYAKQQYIDWDLL